jgi:hypothetical protein
LWVLGFSARDGHIFRYDTRARAFTDTPPITIPAPVGNDSRVSLCRGVFINRADRDYLVLIEFEGAGALDTAQTYPLAIIDITDPINPITTPYATGQGIFAGDTPEVSPVLRGIATDGTHAYVITPSWRTRSDGRGRLYTLAIDPATGAPTRLHTVDAGLAEDRCNSTLHFVPALAVAPMGRVGVAPTPHVFVGTDTHLHIYDAATLANGTADAPIARIDTTAYGTLPTTIAQGIED